MSVLSRYATGVAALLVLSACDPRFVHQSDLNAREIANLSGTWSGRASMTLSGSKECPRFYLWRMQVADGSVNGEVVDAATPEATPGTYTTFVEYDGSMHANLRTRGRELAVLGSFTHDGFTGTARSQECNYAVSLTHEGRGK